MTHRRDQHSTATRRGSRAFAAVAVVMATLMAAACSGGSGGGNGGETGGNSSGSDASTPASVDPAVVAFLAADPTFADPTYDLPAAVDVPIVAATGGRVDLAITPTVTASLEIPAGALPADTTLTVTPITGLAVEGGSSDAQTTYGVDVLPSLDFLLAPVTLTLTSSDGWGGGDAEALADHAFAVDSDAVLTSDAALVRDGQIVIVLTHFSGHGTSPAAAPTSSASLETYRQGVRRVLTSDAYGASGNDVPSADALQQLEDLRNAYERDGLQPMVNGAGECAARRVIDEAEQFDALAQQVDPSYERATTLGKVANAWETMLKNEISCARDECLAGIPTSAGRLMWVAHYLMIGFYASAELEGQANDLAMEVARDFRTCQQYRVTVNGSVKGTVGGLNLDRSFPVTESMRLEGVSDPTGPRPMALTYQQVGWADGVGQILTDLTNSAWTQIMIPTARGTVEMADAFGVPVDPAIRPENLPTNFSFQCGLGSLGSAADTAVEFQNTGGPEVPPTPILTVATGALNGDITCDDTVNPGWKFAETVHRQWEPFYLWPALSTLPGMTVDGTTLRYDFKPDDAASEVSWTYSVTLAGPFNGAAFSDGQVRISMHLTPVETDRPSDATSPPVVPPAPPADPMAPEIPPWTDLFNYEASRYVALIFNVQAFSLPT